MDVRKWFQVLVVGGGALACGVPGSTTPEEAATSAPVVEAPADAGPGGVEVDAGRVCVRTPNGLVRFVDEAPPGSCCIWGLDHPCCP